MKVFTNFGKAVTKAAVGAMIVFGVADTDIASAQGEKRFTPVGNFSGGDPIRVARVVRKVGPTIVPVIDSNAILNLEYSQIRQAPVQKADKKIAEPVVVKEPTLAELQTRLKEAEQQYKGAKLAYTQAVRSKDKTRVDQAKAHRTKMAFAVKQAKKDVHAKQHAMKANPAAEKRVQTVRQSTGGDQAKAAAGAHKK